MAWELALYRPLRDLASWLWRLRSKPDPAEVLKERARWKGEFEAHYHILDGQDLIIRDIARMDNYPEVSGKKKGISAWFKLEFKSLYHRGFEAFMRIESIKYFEAHDGWAFCHYEEPGAVSAYCVGRIPYDAVRGVDWDGDEYYSCPHIYCAFTNRKRKEPYEDIVFYNRRGGVERPYFVEIANYDQVRRLSKKLGRGSW